MATRMGILRDKAIDIIQGKLSVKIKVIFRCDHCHCNSIWEIYMTLKLHQI